ncbi:transglutaminase-like cysteine peptidase [Aureimonas sp. ME7]|uniref:transglutaminase-like cysteine peptidase n=1 Tax=Aureimonas sp. ME7 TaxID=2744252 RepID=UPI0015F58175|nr:transglutaminase-like cysteine peptidase [Aureimonas sp. ME7]
MIFRRFFSAAVVLCLFSGFGSAMAAPAASGMNVGGPTKQPFGHHAFCQRLPTECGPINASAQAPVVLDAALMRLVAKVNLEVNGAIKPASDQELYGQEEVWAFPTDRGDCEDYALLKRQRLHAAGISLADLLLTVVKKRDGTGHAVLTLRTRSGDFVLDNLDWRVRPWNEVPYRFIKRQSSANAGTWLEIESGSDPLVSAVSP